MKTLKSARFKVRVKHHLILSAVIGLLLFAFIKWIPGNDLKYLWSMSTGYTSIILLAITLLLGPISIYNKRPNPVSSDLRRDVGIWCGLVGLLHIIVGIQVHMGNIWLYFFKAVQGEDSFVFRDDLFGVANYTGFLAGLIMIVLLLLSNDISLKWLRVKRWKNIQKWNYAFFALILAHGIMFQIIEKRIPAIVILFAIIMLIPLIGQSFGIISTIRERKSTN